MRDMTRDLTDTVIAVTGASSGIGLASARMLVEGGARVAVQARRSERLDQLVDELGSDKVVSIHRQQRVGCAFGGRAVPVGAAGW